MLAEFAEWWLTQMRSMLPTALFPPAMQPDARIITLDRLDNPSGAILLRRKGVESAIAALDLDHPRPLAEPGLATGLRLPGENLLTREVTLPLGAARNAESVIGFEIDRLTPFTADELFWGIGAVKPDRAHGRLSLQLFFVLRAEIDPLLQALRRIGLNPSFIETDSGRIDLATEHRSPARWAQAMPAALCGVLALACLASPFLRQQMALNAASQAIAAASPTADAAQNLRRQLEIAASGSQAIAAARRAGDAIQVLASLTDALPDGTSLDDLTLKSGDVTFDGRSSNAAALIGRLSAVPSLKNPSFTAPVTRTQDGGADQFSLHATVQE